jgi:sulfoxide reductase heme-binding subunit YedZ
MESISITTRAPRQGGWLRAILLVLMMALIFGSFLIVLWVARSPAGQGIGAALKGLFALESVQSWWYITRAAGLTAYFLMWLSMVWGMAVSARVFQPLLEGAHAYDFHEFLSLLGLGFVGLHVGVLMLDKYLPFSVAQILIPFTNTYRPFWTGLGIIGLYILLLVTITFYLRRSIGIRAFRAIHVLSLLGYLGTTLHGFFGGTDSALPVSRLLYLSTFLVVFLLTIYCLAWAALSRREKTELEARMLAERRRGHRSPAKRRQTA